MQPHLLSIATAVPHHIIGREAVTGLARSLFGEGIDRMLPVFENSGIEKRHSCVPLDWYLQHHGWMERADLFVANAVDLAEAAATEALRRARLSVEQIDAVVAITTTGVSTPSLDALLLERLPFRRDVTRLPVFGLGCCGGVLGLARAAALAKASPGSRVLLVVVELCGLTFRRGDLSKGNVVATALFGDGAAAAIISSRGDGPVLAAWGEHTWRDSLDVMGWRIEDDGFGVLFSRDIPTLVRQRLRDALDHWLDHHGSSLADVNGYALHPGGTKVVAALEDALDLPRGWLATEREVLRDFGNMSAATVLFVLERVLRHPLPRRTLVSALGPGFTAGFLLLEGEA
jgi:alkylresorcinol/alkylpyrone synthase